MIVQCPSCNGRFTVADTAFAAGPRRMKCGRCDHVWRAGASTDPAPPPPKAAPAVPPPRAAASPTRPAAAASPSAPARPARRGGGLWIGWGLLVLLIAGVAAGGWFARGWLVEVWPPSERAYTWLGIALPRVELVEVHDTVTQDGDVERLVIEGTIANRADHALPTPVVTVVLFDHRGEPLQDWRVALASATLAPGQSVSFHTEVAYPAGGTKPAWEVHLDRTHADDDMVPPSEGPADHDETADEHSAEEQTDGNHPEPTDDHDATDPAEPEH